VTSRGISETRRMLRYTDDLLTATRYTAYPLGRFLVVLVKVAIRWDTVALSEAQGGVNVFSRFHSESDLGRAPTRGGPTVFETGVGVRSSVPASSPSRG
jgi:hypothetical protein